MSTPDESTVADPLALDPVDMSIDPLAGAIPVSEDEEPVNDFDPDSTEDLGPIEIDE